MYYINYYFIFSIIGHFLESILFNKSGILLGYWTPIYGIGSIIILFINKKINGKFKPLKLFLLCSIILSIIEAIGGKLIENIFQITFWDYSNYKFNLGKYISLEISIIWGLASLLLIYILKPITDKIISKIPKYLTFVLIIILFIDIFLTIIIKH